MMSSFLAGMGGYMPSNLDYSKLDVPGMIEKEEKKQGLQSMLKGVGKNKNLRNFDYNPNVQSLDIEPSSSQSFLSMLLGI